MDRELLGTVLKRKLTFFGHACRNTKCSLMKTVIQGKLEAKRKQRRPRTHYFENIKKWTGKTTPEIYDDVNRRQEWREVVQRAMRAANTSGDAG